MAESDFTQYNTQSKRVNFKKQSWHRTPPSINQEFAAQTHDIARGVACILEFIEASDIAHDCEPSSDNPTLTPVDKGALMRLAIRSLGLLGDKAETAISKANTAA